MVAFVCHNLSVSAIGLLQTEWLHKIFTHSFNWDHEFAFFLSFFHLRAWWGLQLFHICWEVICVIIPSMKRFFIQTLSRSIHSHLYRTVRSSFGIFRVVILAEWFIKILKTWRSLPFKLNLITPSSRKRIVSCSAPLEGAWSLTLIFLIVLSYFLLNLVFQLLLFFLFFLQLGHIFVLVELIYAIFCFILV